MQSTNHSDTDILFNYSKILDLYQVPNEAHLDKGHETVNMSIECTAVQSCPSWLLVLQQQVSTLAVQKPFEQGSFSQWSSEMECCASKLILQSGSIMAVSWQEGLQLSFWATSQSSHNHLGMTWWMAFWCAFWCYQTHLTTFPTTPYYTLFPHRIKNLPYSATVLLANKTNNQLCHKSWIKLYWKPKLAIQHEHKTNKKKCSLSKLWGARIVQVLGFHRTLATPGWMSTLPQSTISTMWPTQHSARRSITGIINW